MSERPPDSGVYKLSSIVVATRERTESFESLDDMPAVLRARCVRALHSTDTHTILIADSNGREYLRRALAEQEKPAPPAPVSVFRRFPWRLGVEILGVAAAGLALWLLATLR